MPVRVQVIELVHHRRIGAALAAADRALLSAADFLVVPRISSVENDSAFADHEQSIDVAVGAGARVAVDRVETRRTGRWRLHEDEHGRERGNDCEHVGRMMSVYSGT